jgi:hypothetical protein
MVFSLEIISYKNFFLYAVSLFVSDATTVKNLELLQNARDPKSDHTTALARPAFHCSC